MTAREGTHARSVVPLKPSACPEPGLTALRGRVPSAVLGAADTALIRAQLGATLAAAVLDGAPPEQVAERFGEMTGCSVALLGADLSTMQKGLDGDAASPPPPEVAHLLAGIARRGQVVTLAPTASWSTRRSHVAPLLAAGQLLGYLVMYEHQPLDPELVAASLQNTATLCAISMVQERRRDELANELRYDLVSGLLLRQSHGVADLRRWSELLGLADGGSYRVLCTDITAPAADAPGGSAATCAHVLSALARELGAKVPGAISAYRGSDFISLVPDSTAHEEGTTRSVRALINEAVKRVQARFPSVELAAGLGRVRVAPVTLAESGADARNAILVQRRFKGATGVLSFEELGVYSLLYQVADPAELRAFVDRVLGRLIAYDRRRHTDLLRTLQAILEHNGSLVNAARVLGVHVNTVAYRHERIEAITGLDLSRSDDRLMSYLALKIIDGLPREAARAKVR
jgi:sugar diacid utilization regulator